VKKTTTTKTTAKPAKRAPRKTTTAKTEASGLELAKIVAQGMFEKKAENIVILDMRNIAAASADFFVISHAGNDKQVEAIANSAEEEVWKITGERPWHREGFDNLEWVLLDYFDVVAHVFLEDKREFYGVEELWGDAIEVPFKGK
jgi:ribosome-associated protein